jgi:DNA replication and repair protein RecF
VHLAALRLRNFRNYARLDVEFSPGFHLLLGNNGQGKTNVMEAIYLIASLRSFRAVGGAQMIRHAQPHYFVGGKIISDSEHDVKLFWARTEKQITLDARPIRKLVDYLGTFRAVVFCSEDVTIVKGPASGRRRFVDLLLSQTVPTYLPQLQRYTRAIRSRNALLKQRSFDENLLESFTVEAVAAGERIITLRRKLTPKLLELARAAYRSISNDAEELTLDYQSSVKRDFLVELRQSRAREQTLRTTVIGPHRDDLQLGIGGRSAAQFGSEGQKRSVAIALKMAQTELLTTVHGTPPVLLVDDIMGELDVKRRSGFLPLLTRVNQARSQVFMTCTEENWPRELGDSIQRWEVNAGALRKS